MIPSYSIFPAYLVEILTRNRGAVTLRWDSVPEENADADADADAKAKAKSKAKSMGSGHKVIWIDGTTERWKRRVS